MLHTYNGFILIRIKWEKIVTFGHILTLRKKYGKGMKERFFRYRLGADSEKYYLKKVMTIRR